MVERIVDAGARVLVAHGYEGASTNRIAAEAGVSPGSLYQYFPNKDAIVLAVVQAYRERIERDIADELTKMLDDPPDDVVPGILGALVDALSREPEILRAIVEKVPHHTGLDTFAQFERRIGDLMRGYLMMRRDLLRDTNLETLIWVVVQVVEHLTVRYVLEEPSITRDEFVDELATLTINYVVAPQLARAAHEVHERRHTAGL
ncbi:MAG: TetR/AcrR family transcriptional regulator [Solirubrobacteraceae bacterium]|nr:TetR/AcrR family transcriptional regulator [Solirubrobacteraceae bacterium]